MPYDLAAHWSTLQESLTSFDKQYGHSVAENSEDKLAYELAKEMLEEMAETGKAMEESWSPYTKMTLGKEIDNLNRKKFGEEELPMIKGNKSLHFAQLVFLPHLKRSLTIKYSELVLTLSKGIGIDIEAKRQKAKALVAKLEIKIKDYISNHSKLKEQSIFADLKTQAQIPFEDESLDARNRVVL